jgi:hypothetical protein
MLRLAPPVRRNLNFRGSAGPKTLNPTLSDVMTALIQVQENQAQILSAIDALQQSVNTLTINQGGTALGGSPGNLW